MKQGNTTIRILNDSIQNIEKNVGTFLCENNFTIKRRQEDSNCIFIEAHNKTKNIWTLFWRNCFQILFMEISNTNGKTILKISPELFRNFRFFLRGTFICLFLSIIICYIACINATKLAQLNTQNLMLVPFWLLLGVSLSLISIAYVMKYSWDNKFNSRLDIHLEVKSSGVIQDMVAPDGLWFILATIIFLVTVVLVRIEEIGYFNLLGPIVIIFSLLACITLLVSFWKKELLIRLSPNLFIIITSSLFLLFLNIPTFFLLFSEVFPEGFLNAEISLSSWVSLLPSLLPILLSLAAPLLLILGMFFVLWHSTIKNMDVFEHNLIKFSLSTQVTDSEGYRAFHAAPSFEVVVRIFILVSWLVYVLLFLFVMLLGTSFLYYSLSGKISPHMFHSIKDIIWTGRLSWHVLFLPFNSHVRQMSFRCFAFMYSAITLTLPLIIVKANIKTFLESRKVLKHICDDKEISTMVTQISDKCGIKMPLIHITGTQNIDASVSHLGYPHFANILTITKGAVENLTHEETEGLIAHELCHIKRHTLSFNVLTLLSEWTFMGKWFLVTVLNTVKAEYEADDFAISWLEGKGIKKTFFVDMLKKIEVSKSMPTKSKMKNFLMGSHINIQNLFSENTQARKQKFIYTLKRVWRLYSGEEISFYVYPTIKQRIERIMDQA